MEVQKHQAWSLQASILCVARDAIDIGIVCMLPMSRYVGDIWSGLIDLLTNQGMFNALNGLGGSGQLDAHVEASTASNSALYATFAVVGFFAGTVTNVVGVRTALCFGGLGYCVYVSAFLCFNHTQNLGYVIFSGALLGCCAGVLWSAQGAIMMSYPPERLKGRYISWFWVIFNLGGVIGSLVSAMDTSPITRS